MDLASTLGAIAGELASPHGIVIVAAIVFGVAFWLHKRREQG